MSDDPAPLVFVYATFPDLATAERIVTELVADKLIACANLLPGMVSIYPWKGAIERAEEVAAILKTRASLAEAAIRALQAKHPYEVPAAMVIPLGAVSEEYGRWLMRETDREA